MKPLKEAKCLTCGQGFTAKPIYDEAEQDGQPDVFQGYQRYCAACVANPYAEVDRDVLHAVKLYCSGLTTRSELLDSLTALSASKLR